MKRLASMLFGKTLRLHHSVVPPEHLANPRYREHLFHEHAEVSSEELFFDLVFVAVGIELGDFLKASLLDADTDHDVSKAILLTCALFATTWLTWFHTNILLTRFDVSRPWSGLVFLVMVGTLGMAIHAIDTNDDGVLVSGFGPNNGWIFGSLLLSRIAFMILYVAVIIKIPLSRPMLIKYVMCFLISCGLLAGAASQTDINTASVLWVIALAVELLMYPLGLLTNHQYQLTVNTAHLLERNQLWVILILGESVISITSEQHVLDARYYVVVVCAFLVVYWLMLLHIKSQHLFDERAEEHALDHSPFWAFIFDTIQLFITTGMLVMAVGFKLAIKNAADDYKYTPRYAWILTISLGLTLIMMNASRVCHKLRPLLICGRPANVHVIWLSQFVLSFALIFFAYLVDDVSKTSTTSSPSDGLDSDSATDSMDGTGLADSSTYGSGNGTYVYGSQHFGPSRLVPLLAGFVLSVLLIESMVTAEDEDEDMSELEDFQVSKAVQTDLHMIPHQVKHSSVLSSLKKTIRFQTRLSQSANSLPNAASDRRVRSLGGVRRNLDSAEFNRRSIVSDASTGAGTDMIDQGVDASSDLESSYGQRNAVSASASAHRLNSSHAMSNSASRDSMRRRMKTQSFHSFNVFRRHGHSSASNLRNRAGHESVEFIDYSLLPDSVENVDEYMQELEQQAYDEQQQQKQREGPLTSSVTRDDGRRHVSFADLVGMDIETDLDADDKGTRAPRQSSSGSDKATDGSESGVRRTGLSSSVDADVGTDSLLAHEPDADSISSAESGLMLHVSPSSAGTSAPPSSSRYSDTSTFNFEEHPSNTTSVV